MIGKATVNLAFWAAFVSFTGSAAVALSPCTSSCSSITVGSASAAPGGVASVAVEFTQAADDGQAGQGNDEIAAVAFTLGIPGTGAASPLTIDCADNNSDGIPDGVTVDAAIASTFRVVIENAFCTNRNRCLCPTKAEQNRDDFINVAVYGPKDLPAEGPVDIPVLPSGPLLSVALRVPADASVGEVPLTIYEEGGTTKPQFAATFSQGDKAAVDQTADRGADVSKVTVTNGKITVSGTACVGDCDGGGTVTVDELVRGVNIALGTQAIAVCSQFDRNSDGQVTVDELVAGVNNALRGCSGG